MARFSGDAQYAKRLGLVSSLEEHWISSVQIQICIAMKSETAGNLHLITSVLYFGHGDRSVRQFAGAVVRQQSVLQHGGDVGDGHDAVEFPNFHRDKPVFIGALGGLLS